MVWGPQPAPPHPGLVLLAARPGAASHWSSDTELGVGTLRPPRCTALQESASRGEGGGSERPQDALRSRLPHPQGVGSPRWCLCGGGGLLCPQSLGSRLLARGPGCRLTDQHCCLAWLGVLAASYAGERRQALFI